MTAGWSLWQGRAGSFAESRIRESAQGLVQRLLADPKLTSPPRSCSRL
ncbi:hypothetical protein [Streptomyces sp. V2I9]|nr:hypothetical protein [Streptomyces sp. V2I9]MDQ0986724.1 hypothetical protein [Streptomyces sp. V2I9]